MAINKYPRIIYFLKDACADEAEAADALAYGSNVVFRNAAFATDSGLEACDGVGGSVPASYKAAFPDGLTVIAAFEEAQKVAKRGADTKAAEDAPTVSAETTSSPLAGETDDTVGGADDDEEEQPVVAPGWSSTRR